MKTVRGMAGTGNARELAEMLRQLGRGRDTVLAHITPREAMMLKAQGGRGSINPATGLPEFEEDYFGPEFDPYMGMDVTSTGNYQTQPAIDMTGFRQPTPFEAAMTPQEMPSGMRYEMNLPLDTERVDITSRMYQEPFGVSERQYLPQVPEQPGMIQRGAQTVEDTANRLREMARQYPTTARLLGTGATTLPALIQTMQARKDAARAAEQYRQLGAPLRTQGENLRQQALAGQLTPQQAQQLEAERARLRQSAASRGTTTGTQAAMIENQLARTRAALSETNLNNAIKMLNLANAYDEEAIRLKLSSDQRINSLVGSIFANLGATIGSTPSQQVSTQQNLPVTRRPEIPQRG